MRTRPCERLLGLGRVAHHRRATHEFPHDARRGVRVLLDLCPSRCGRVLHLGDVDRARSRAPDIARTHHDAQSPPGSVTHARFGGESPL
jgi:hypothetical protein